MVTLTVAVVLGFIDDLRKMSLGVKIAGYFGVGASAGITYVIFGGSFLPAVYLCLLVVICQSAVNSIDGLDGLASGITVVFGVGAVVPAMFTGNSYLLLIVGVMISTLGAFLKYESYPAEIYLGSAGRLMLGAFLAVTGFYTFKHFSMFQSLMGVLILVGIPIFNVLVTFTRQIINSKPVFAPGRSQFYNILMDQKGFGHMEAVMACYLLQLVCALLAVIYYLTAANWRLLIFIIILVNTVVFTIFHKLLVADTTSDLSLHN